MTSESGQDPGEAHSGVDHRLAHAPHHGVDWHHAEVGVFVHEGDGPGGEEAEGEGDDEAHDEDHDAVEAAQGVAPEGSESQDGGRAVEDGAGEETPHEHCHPGGGRMSGKFSTTKTIKLDIYGSKRPLKSNQIMKEDATQSYS